MEQDCGNCVNPSSIWSIDLLNELFEGYLFSFVGTRVLIVFSVVIVVVLIFFSAEIKDHQNKNC